MLAPLTETNTIVTDDTNAPLHAGTDLFLGDGGRWSILNALVAPKRYNPWLHIGVVQCDFVLNILPAVITDLADQIYPDLMPQHGFWEHPRAKPIRLIEFDLSGLGGVEVVGDATQVDFCVVDISDENDMMYAPTTDALFSVSGSLGDDVDKFVDDPAIAQLQTKNVYTVNAIKNFGRVNSRRLRSSPSILHAVVQIINHSVLHGFRPVVNLDDDDHSLEIEARLDPDHLLLLHVRGSGIVDGQIYSKSFGTKTIDSTKASDFLDWLVSKDGQDT